ncbi:MAG: 16S rRNA (guanine(527)-N(7))-methyltransferase RsmG [Clostridia bacterium]|nr:16S rRNA (guanine(527)-N(7))-methyltransferase RsmG [Clostridia bacterium]
MDEYFSDFSNIMLKNKLNGYIKQELAEKFKVLSQLLVEENKKYNLTAIKDERLILPLHFADCLLALEFLPRSGALIDVGCGAGFPTLPLAIACADLRITALDSTEKKLRFVEKVCAELGLRNVTVAVGRAEELAKTSGFRGKFDAVTARAVSRLNVLSELCIPFLKKEGVFVAMKGAMGQEESDEASKGIALLGGRLRGVYGKKLYISENEAQERSFVVVRKESSTPESYPRMYSKIVKNPL